MPLYSGTKPDYTTQDASSYKANIDGAISTIADQPAINGIAASLLFSAPFKNSLAFNGVGYIDFDRASGASYRDRYGILRSAAVDEPRFEKNGLLIEGQATNYLLHSNDLTNAAWAKLNVTITGDATTAPDGNVDADKVEETTATGNHAVGQVSAIGSGLMTGSIFLKAAERDHVRVVLYNATDLVFAEAFVDLTDGSIVSNPSGSVAVEEFYDGWYRVSLTGTATVANSQFDAYITIGPSTYSYTGVAGNGLYAFGGQLELVGFQTSYIQTAAVAVTRSPDLCNLLADNNLPGLNEDISIIVDVDVLGSNSSDQYVFAWSGVTSANLLAYKVSNLNPTYNLGTERDIGSVALTPKTLTRFGLVGSGSVDNEKAFINGVLTNSGARGSQTGNLLSSTLLYLGKSATTNYLYGHISNLRIYDVAFTDDQMGIM